ncbi:MAG TPA: aminotransferase class III-fold pyridoxal phosphate-dependent enzyme [Candidatus Acidoferrum sp.]
MYVEKAQSVYCYIEDGRKILDAISAWWVTLEGHANPRTVAAIRDRAKKLACGVERGRFEEKLSA